MINRHFKSKTSDILENLNTNERGHNRISIRSPILSPKSSRSNRSNNSAKNR